MKDPKLRFKQYCDDWKEVKFGEIVIKESKSVISSANIPCIEYEDVVSNEGRLNKNIKNKNVCKKGIYFDESDILYGKLRPYLHNWLNPNFSGVAVGDWWVIKPVDINKNFVYRLIQTKNFDMIANQSAGSKMPRADWNLIYKSSFLIPPSEEEQIKISNLFDELDNFIFINKNQIDNLIRQKKSVSNKLFRQRIGFKDINRKEYPNWKKMPLKDILEISAKLNREKKYSKKDVLSVSDEYGIVNQLRLQGRSFAADDVSKYKIVENNNIVYTKSPLKSKPYGIIKIVKDAEGILSPLYIVNKVREGNDPLFIYYYFDDPDRTNRYLKPLVRMGAKHTMNIGNDEWLSGNIKVPCYEEQKKISSILLAYDELIATKKKQLEVLQNIKKGFLQQMFPYEEKESKEEQA